MKARGSSMKILCLSMRRGGDLRLLEESPGIDAGSLEAVVGQTDVAGFDRIFNEDVDLGAYEYFAPALDIDDVTVAADSETAEFTVRLSKF